MPTTQQLREQRANIWDQMVATMDAGTGPDGAMTAEEGAKYDALEKDYDGLDVQIARAERHDERTASNSKVDRSGVMPPENSNELGDEPAEGYTKAFALWMKGGLSALDGEEQKTLRAGFVKDDSIRNAAGVGNGAAGGYTVPPAFRQKIIERITFAASMRQLAEVITTDTGAELPWPTVDDTGNEGAILAENTQASEQDVVFGQASIGAYTYTSRIVRASLQLLQDNAFDFEGWLARALGDRVGRIQNRHFTVGTGTNQPDGLVTSAPVGVTAAAADKVTYEELVDLTESLDAAYLEGGNLRFMYHQAVRKGLRKLKDDQGRPLWEPSLTAGAPATLLGYGVSVNNYMPTPAAGAKSMAFGDIREAYLIRDVSDFALLRLSERYADFLQVGFLGFQRSDGTLQNGAAVRTLQQAG